MALIAVSFLTQNVGAMDEHDAAKAGSNAGQIPLVQDAVNRDVKGAQAPVQQEASELEKALFYFFGGGGENQNFTL